MNTSRLIYKSRASSDVVSNQALRKLEQEASRNNQQEGITGLLVLIGNTYLQVLEGPSVEITALFGGILADKRHQQVELLSFETGVEPYFEDWNMRLVDLYDMPGERRAQMASKYPAQDGEIRVPSDRHKLYAFLLDAKYLCDSTPWNAPGDPQRSASDVKDVS